MRTSLESDSFCFNQQCQIIATWHFFFGFVLPNFTGCSKIDKNVSQMESQDIIRWYLPSAQLLKKVLPSFSDLIVLITEFDSYRTTNRNNYRRTYPAHNMLIEFWKFRRIQFHLSSTLSWPRYAKVAVKRYRYTNIWFTPLERCRYTASL